MRVSHEQANPNTALSGDKQLKRYGVTPSYTSYLNPIRNVHRNPFEGIAHTYSYSTSHEHEHVFCLWVMQFVCYENVLTTRACAQMRAPACAAKSKRLAQNIQHPRGLDRVVNILPIRIRSVAMTCPHQCQSFRLTTHLSQPLEVDVAVAVVATPRVQHHLLLFRRLLLLG